MSGLAEDADQGTRDGCGIGAGEIHYAAIKPQHDVVTVTVLFGYLEKVTKPSVKFPQSAALRDNACSGHIGRPNFFRQYSILTLSSQPLDRDT
jgi:hypothetical protein